MSDVIEIDAGRPWWRLNLRELWEKRDLFLLLLRKDLLASYKQSLLGPAWFVIQPLVTSLVFGLLFGRFARLSPPRVPPFLYFLAGLVFWHYFQATVTNVSASLVANASILRKIYFPRLIAPLVAAGVSTIHFAVNYLVFLLIYLAHCLFAGWRSPLALRDLPVVLLMPVFLALVATGIGVWLAAWSVTYRDLRISTPMLLNIWMFATPIIWPLRLAPADKRWLFALNPMTPLVELHRAIFLGTPVPELQHLALGAGTGLLALVIGLAVFSRVQGTLVDTL
ncbi:MAG TPA: ABC transporter permease [Candidatus Methanoperedens sp.]|nr:ABC transporter permease [Candidatus Methanoperedens sp.]